MAEALDDIFAPRTYYSPSYRVRDKYARRLFNAERILITTGVRISYTVSMTSQSRIRRGYIIGALGVILALLGLFITSAMDSEDWLWFGFLFLGGLYLVGRAWIADELR